MSPATPVKPKPKRGRPALPIADRRTVRMKTFMTKAEADHAYRVSRRMRRSISDLMREAFSRVYGY